MSTSLMRCREARPYLSAYIDGELDGVLRERVQMHLASCALCSQVVTRYQAVDSLLGTLPATVPSPDVFDQVLAATSSQNKERAIRQSLRRPGNALAPRSLPAFLVADTNLAAPMPSVRQRSQSRRSWLLASALPTLAALLIIALSLFSFQGRSRQPSIVLHPTATANPENALQKANQVVFHQWAPKLSFSPVLPNTLPAGAGFQSANVGTFSDGVKYLDVTWTLDVPYNALHLREAGESLSSRVDYPVAQTNDLQTWQLPGEPQWQNLSDSTNSGSLVVGEDRPKFSITLDIGFRYGNLNVSNNPYTRGALTDLRVTSLSMDRLYLPLNSIAAPDGSLVVHYEMQTTGVTGGPAYQWNVYWDNQRDQGRAALSNGSGTLLYTDYLYGGSVTRCNSQGCERIPASDPSVFHDPFKLGNKAQSFFDTINSFVSDGELWNLGTYLAPPDLEVGSVPVYELAYVSGPYPITIYVSTNMQVLGVISETGPGSGSPGGTYAASPLLPLGSCTIHYPLIVYLDGHSPGIPKLTTTAQPTGIQIPTVATCQPSS